MKDELIQQLRMLGMGRVNAAQAIADVIEAMVAKAVAAPAPVDLAKVKEDCLAAAEVLKAETVEIEVEPSPTSWAGLEKTRADVVAEYFAPPHDPAPAKPKRKKA